MFPAAPYRLREGNTTVAPVGLPGFAGVYHPVVAEFYAERGEGSPGDALVVQAQARPDPREEYRTAEFDVSEPRLVEERGEFFSREGEAVRATVREMTFFIPLYRISPAVGEDESLPARPQQSQELPNGFEAGLVVGEHLYDPGAVEPVYALAGYGDVLESRTNEADTPGGFSRERAFESSAGDLEAFGGVIHPDDLAGESGEVREVSPRTAPGIEDGVVGAVSQP